MILILLQLISSIAFAQTSNINNLLCLKLENVTIGCVPSSRELCHSGQPANCDLLDQRVSCGYVKGRGKYYKPSESFVRNLECADYEDPVCTPGPNDVPICVQGACRVYKPPHCQLECHQCYQEARPNGTVPIHGCKKFCGEKYCADESECERFKRAVEDCQNPNVPNPEGGCFIQPCPLTIDNCTPGPSADPNAAAQGVDLNCFYVPAIKRPLCEPTQTCPDRLQIPAGLNPPPSPGNCFYDAPQNTRPCQFFEDPPGSGTMFIRVESSTNECEIPQFSRQTLYNPDDMRICPWIEYERRQENEIDDPPMCRDVTDGNRFPCDCCECNGNESGCKTCGPNALPYCGRTSASCPVPP